MLALQALVPERLRGAFPELTLPEARRIVAAVQRGDDLRGHVVQVRRTSLEAVRRGGEVPALTVRAEQASKLDPFVKLAFSTHDGHVVEAVRIPLERAGRYSVCVSSQAGCALACSFCATGRLGLQRNLEAWEIVEQVRVVRAGITHGRVHGVVFQGMGEPLSNLDRVLQAIEVMTEPAALAIDGRNITVCTAGLPAGIRRLAAEAPRVRLAISVHSVDPAVRGRIMPIAAAHDLEEVLAAGAEHARATGLAPMWAVTLLEGVNDTLDQARALAARALAFRAAAGVMPRLSVIAYNPIGGADPFRRSAGVRDAAYRDAIKAAGVPVHRRYSGGADVAAACGQLAGA
jgi:23S rRNA (adenine2503-C2)-methyltransferase